MTEAVLDPASWRRASGAAARTRASDRDPLAFPVGRPMKANRRFLRRIRRPRPAVRAPLLAAAILLRLSLAERVGAVGPAPAAPRAAGHHAPWSASCSAFGSRCAGPVPPVVAGPLRMAESVHLLPDARAPPRLASIGGAARPRWPSRRAANALGPPAQCDARATSNSRSPMPSLEVEQERIASPR